MHAGTGMLMNMLVRPLRTHEMSGLASLHEQMKPDDVIVGDRGFCSYAHLCLVFQANMHAVFRLHHSVVTSFRKNRPCRKQLPKSQRKGMPASRYVRKLGRNDQLVEYVKPKGKPKWMSKPQYDMLPDSLIVRELRYKISRPGFRSKQVTLVTTLTDCHRYPAKQLIRLYGDSWQIEVDFRHLKTTMAMEVLHCQTVEGVLKELWMYVLVYNLVRQVMLKAAQRQRVHPDRISFIDALRWLSCVRLGQTLTDLVVNPLRDGRIEPRVIKRRMKKYALMNKPRHQLRQEIINAEVTD
jgi:hypothetical protein